MLRNETGSQIFSSHVDMQGNYMPIISVNNFQISINLAYLQLVYNTGLAWIQAEIRKIIYLEIIMEEAAEVQGKIALLRR